MRTSGTSAGVPWAPAGGASAAAISRNEASSFGFMNFLRAQTRNRFPRLLYLLACKHLRSTAAPTGQLARDLGMFVKLLLRTSNPEFFAALQDAGISFTQLKCLGLLSDAGEPKSLGRLSEELGLSLPAISRAVDGLVQRGRASSAPEDPSDRRCKLVSLSAGGRATYERVLAVRIAAVKRFVEELEPLERAALGAALHPIVERLDA